MFNKRADAALVLENILFAGALVDKSDTHSLIQKRKLAQTFRQYVITENSIGEDLRAGFKTNVGAGLAGVANNTQRRFRLPEVICLMMNFTAAAYGQIQGFGQRI